MGQYRHGEEFLDQPPEAIDNALVRPGEVKRRMKKKPAEVKPTDEWGWKQSEKVRSGSGLLAAWAGQGYRLPDPRREEDFALHLRLMEAAFFDDQHAGFGLENANSKIETGKGDEFPVSNFQFPNANPETEQTEEEPEPEPQYVVEKLIWAFLFSEPERAFQAAEQCNRRVGRPSASWKKRCKRPWAKKTVDSRRGKTGERGMRKRANGETSGVRCPLIGEVCVICHLGPWARETL